MKSRFLHAALAAALFASAESSGAAQTVSSASARLDSQLPPLPATFARSNEGRTTIRAVRLAQPITLDGRLDEDVYKSTQPAAGFIQFEPRNGAPATEDTQLWIFFDAQNMYVAFHCLDSEPDKILANEMRRDNRNIWLNDSISFTFDTFYDRRSAFYFQTNPLGGLRDALVVDERNINYDWNTVWDVKTRRSGRGWIGEMAIPFKSLRYPRGRSQTWGFQFTRFVRRKNEQSLLSPVPRSYGGSASFHLQDAATLVGVEVPPPSRNLELKPSLISDLTTNRAAAPPVSNDLDASLSLDAKYGLSSSMFLDFTYNTDFAQIEIDEQQVNLTRFSLFFPEKRDFFLEGQTVFDFGGVSTAGQSDTPILFFTRRIGLNAGQPVPIQAGGRLMGRAGRLSVGVLDIRTDDEPGANALATNFLVARLKRDILRRSSVGAIATRRTPSLSGVGSNTVYGVDANMAFYQNVQVSAYYARSDTPGRRGDASSYRGLFRYFADRYGFEVDRTKAGAAFNPEVGFVRRPDMTRTSATARFSPRPKSIRGVRKIGVETGYDQFVNGSRRLESRLIQPALRIEFENSDLFIVNYNASYEFLQVPFRIARGVTLPAAGYHFEDVLVAYTLGNQRQITGTIGVSHGGFYSGDHTALSYSGRVNLSSQLAVEPRISLDRVRLPEGNFTTRLGGARLTYTISPRMFASGLLQYNSSTNTLETNVRFRWEYQPGSDIFFVYTDGRDTTDRRVADLVNRGVAVKLTRLFRF